ncbi:MAG: PAS domain-containing protein [Deltaproteobacteria bacterium]|nr:PAS domain-containing protein [Deltaproteobacteria bacterium]
MTSPGPEADEQLARERAYASILEHLNGMAYRCRNDEAWTAELITNGSELLTGYRPDELIENRVASLGSIIHPDDTGPLWEKCQANLAARSACSNEYRIVTRGGEVRWVLDVAHGVYDRHGALLAIEGFMSDVTARRRLEETVAHAQRLDSIGRLASGIAHDFNNTLSVIMSSAELVLRSPTIDAGHREDLEEIIRAANRGSELTATLLAFGGHQANGPRPVDVDKVVADVERLLKRTLGDDVELCCNLGCDHAAVVLDPSELEQVLVNLAINARHAMSRGGQLTISTQRTRKNQDAPAEIEIVVADTGDGMSEEVRSKACDLFFTTKRSTGGTGLGLSICQRVLVQAGGRLELESKVGVGTTVRLYLPQKQRDGDSV